MRPFVALLSVVLVSSLACSSGQQQGAKNKACAAACEQGKERCVKECPDGVGQKACKAACDKVEDECVDRCAH